MLVNEYYLYFPMVMLLVNCYLYFSSLGPFVTANGPLGGSGTGQGGVKGPMELCQN